MHDLLFARHTGTLNPHPARQALLPARFFF